MNINFAGHELQLLPEGAIYWRKYSALILSDVHLGKAHIFQKQAVPIPYGSGMTDLKKINALCDSLKVQRLWIVGDLWHGKITDSKLENIIYQNFNHLNLQEYLLIIGNHDRCLMNNTIFTVLPNLDIDNIKFTHEPQSEPNAFNISGHIHPVYCLKSNKQTLRLKCFYQKPRQIILPAFGEFTGGHPIKPKKNETIYMISENTIYSLPR